MKQRKKKTARNGRWTHDSAKEEYWHKQLALWQKSGLSIRAFCKEHGVVETSFYAWRRELIVRAREDGEADALTAQVTPNALTDGRGRKIAIRYRQTEQLATEAQLQEGANPFVPIHLHGAVQVAQPRVFGVTTDADGSKDIEIILPGGARIKVGENSNMRLVAELLSVLKG